METLDIILIVIGCLLLAVAAIALICAVALHRQRSRHKKRQVKPAPWDAEDTLPPPIPAFQPVEDAKRVNDVPALPTVTRLPQPPPQPASTAKRHMHRPDRIQIPPNIFAAQKDEPMVTAIEPSKFGAHLRKLKKNNFLFLYDEFDVLNRQTQYGHDRATTLTAEKNMKRNRFPDVLTFDETRVRLTECEEGTSDYINASYIKSFDGSRIEFIAAQGPIGAPEPVPASTRENTEEHFWRMCWQQRAKCLVMLTQTIEHLKLKCAQYWPGELGDAREFFDASGHLLMRIELVAVTQYESCTQRVFDFTKGDETRSITQYHFEDWLDSKGPESNEKLLDMVLRIRALYLDGPPIVVHCSAGIGRTGVFIALWQLISAINADPSRHVDIVEQVRRMRAQRIRMVQSSEQYASLYECVALYLIQQGLLKEGGETESISQLSEDSRFAIQEVSPV